MGKPSTATSSPPAGSPPGLLPTTATAPAPLSTEPTATVSARDLPLTDTELATESPFPPPLRTATTDMDMSWPPATPLASLIQEPPAATSRGLSSTLATARGALSPSMGQPLPLLRTATTSTATSTPPSTLSASPIPQAGLTSRSPVFTPASTTVATTARGALSPSTAEWPSTLDTPSPPLTGLLRVSALDMATDMGSTATARGPLMPSTELLPLPTLSTRPIPATLVATSRSLAFTPGSATAMELATSTKD